MRSRAWPAFHLLSPLLSLSGENDSLPHSPVLTLIPSNPDVKPGHLQAEVVLNLSSPSFGLDSGAVFAGWDGAAWAPTALLPRFLVHIPRP